MVESPEEIGEERVVKAVLEAIRSHRGEYVRRIVLVSESEEIARIFVSELEKDEED